jgi:hypothetical protein
MEALSDECTMNLGLEILKNCGSELLRTPLGNCPKNLGRACSLALQAAPEWLLVHFAFRIPTKFHGRSIARSPFRSVSLPSSEGRLVTLSSADPSSPLPCRKQYLRVREWTVHNVSRGRRGTGAASTVARDQENVNSVTTTSANKIAGQYTTLAHKLSCSRNSLEFGNATSSTELTATARMTR